MGWIVNLATKIKSLKLYEVLAGFVLGVIAFLSGLLVLANRQRKDAEQRAGEAEIENIELKVEKDVQSKSLPDLIDEHNKDRLRD